MSEIRVTTLKDTDGGNASTSADIYSGRAKAWVNFNGQGAIVVRSSFNVNNIVDNATGNYTINFSNSFPDANYAFTFGNNDADRECESLTINSGSFQLGVWTIELNSRADIAVICTSFFR